jgi:N-acetylglucosamine repressor
VRKIDVRDFERATRTTSRRINLQIALNLIREHQPISRADLARRMDLNRGTMTALINELVGEGSVVEGDTASTTRGRRPKMLYVRTRDRLVIGIDLRFSRTYLMVSDFEGRRSGMESFETVFEPAELVRRLAERVGRLRAEYDAAGEVEGIGLVIPGMVDQATGRVLNAPQLGWKDIEIRGPLEEATGLPVVIENASVACALGHMWMGRRGGDSVGDMVYVMVSDGVGVGVVVDGQVMRGSGNTAGEFGHLPIDLNGPRCLCGARGCWETYTSNLATLARYLGREFSPEEARNLSAHPDLTVPQVIERARGGDQRALNAVRETGYYLGVGLAGIITVANPSRILVGGEIIGAWDLIEERVREMVGERALTPQAARTPIIPEPVNEFPRLRGAAALVSAPFFAAPRVA